MAQIDDLADDLLSEVVRKLPHEGLGPLMTLGRAWARVILRELQYPTALLVEVSRGVFDEDRSFEIVPIVPRFLPPVETLFAEGPVGFRFGDYDYGVTVESSSDGLLLYSTGNRFYLYNPFNRRRRLIPSEALTMYQNTCFVRRGMLLCFDRMESMTRFRIVYVGSVSRLRTNIVFCVYSSMNERSRHGYNLRLDRHFAFLPDSYTDGVYCRGGWAYWLHQSRAQLTCFNVDNNDFLEIGLPAGFDCMFCNDGSYSIYQSGGRLLLAKRISRNQPLIIHELINFGWVLRYSMNVDIILDGLHNDNAFANFRICRLIWREEPCVIFESGSTEVWELLLPSRDSRRAHIFVREVDLPRMHHYI